MTELSRINTKPVETLTGHRTITLDEIEKYNGFSFDSGRGRRNVILPPEAACKGVVIFISNEADEAEGDHGSRMIRLQWVHRHNPKRLCAGVMVSWFGLVGASS